MSERRNSSPGKRSGKPSGNRNIGGSRKPKREDSRAGKSKSKSFDGRKMSDGEAPKKERRKHYTGPKPRPNTEAGFTPKKRVAKSQNTNTGDKGGIRLNKYVANAGMCSRRDADIYIAAGSVTVNGKAITEMGFKVQKGDEVRFDGARITPEPVEYFLLNKPTGFITTTSDERGRKTVMDLVRTATKSRIVPVGRLDRNTTGLLLFTNDGNLAKRLTHPSHEVRKIYHVQLDRSFAIEDLYKLREGITLEDGFIKPDEVDLVQGGKKNEVGIKIHSGKNRIVRRIFAEMGYTVDKLDRVVFAGLTKKDLPRGRFRSLTELEINTLKML